MTQTDISKLPEEDQKGIKSGKFQNYFDVTASLVGHFKGNIL